MQWRRSIVSSTSLSGTCHLEPRGKDEGGGCGRVSPIWSRFNYSILWAHAPGKIDGSLRRREIEDLCPRTTTNAINCL